jgi:hypothetical protein
MSEPCRHCGRPIYYATRDTVYMHEDHTYYCSPDSRKLSATPFPRPPAPPKPNPLGRVRLTLNFTHSDAEEA